MPSSSSDPKSPASRLRHIVLEILWTLRSSITMLERIPPSSQMQDVSDLFTELPALELPGVSEADLHGLRGLRTRVTAQLIQHLVQLSLARFEELKLHQCGFLRGGPAANSSSSSAPSFLSRDAFGCREGSPVDKRHWTLAV